jgi:hypothetical protein
MKEEQTNQNKIFTAPAQKNCFVGMTLKGTLSDVEAIKNFIITQTKAKLIYLHRDSNYLTISTANPEATTN